MEKKVNDITSMDVDFAQWYTDIVKKAELADYSSVRGCLVIRPYAYAIWENIQRIFDAMIKKTGHKNVYMPMFIPESLLQKEKDHVEGFAPEVAWVTRGGGAELEEPMCVRPTSETLFCDHFKHIVHSYRDLPVLYNQWCSVVRWEKTTRPFLRSREFLWQEGHTLHLTEEDARRETLQQLDAYETLLQDHLCIPVIKGQKTDKEKFAGAEDTYTCEAMMHDGKALQSATSHYFGDGFARAFDIQFTDKDNKLAYPFQTSWGSTTRLIGAIIMAHGDDSGLVLPPDVAPTQVIVVPVAQHKEGVLEHANALLEKLRAAGIRADIDESDNSLGWKCAEYEMRGVPVRLEIGPRDIEAKKCVLVRRDNGEKTVCDLEGIEDKIKEELAAFAKAIFEKAKKNLEDNTVDAETLDEMIKSQEGRSRFVRAPWCGDEACEVAIKEKTGLASRCIPFAKEHHTHDGGVCPVCGKKALHTVVFGVAY
ncbi:MAG: proline--tRNA ligase [Clostridia bacterium]|nr:proline--tRNA ligase [Clostridia bacterium]